MRCGAVSFSTQGEVAFQHQCGWERGHVPCRIKSGKYTGQQGDAYASENDGQIVFQCGIEIQRVKCLCLREASHDAQRNQPAQQHGAHGFQHQSRAERADRASQYLLRVDAADAHRGEGGGEVDKVHGGDADDQYGDENHQARVLQVARLEVEPRLGVVVHVTDRNNHGFNFLEIRWLLHLIVDNLVLNQLAVDFFVSDSGFQADESQIAPASPLVEVPFSPMRQ